MRGRACDARSAPEPGSPGDTPDAGWMRGTPASRRRMGASAALPDLRARRLLRFSPAPSRPRPRPFRRAPDLAVVRAGPELSLVLCLRTLRLTPAAAPTTRYRP